MRRRDRLQMRTWMHRHQHGPRSAHNWLFARIYLVPWVLLALVPGCGATEVEPRPAATTDADGHAQSDTDGAAEPVWQDTLAHVTLPPLRTNSDGMTPLLTLPGSGEATRGVFWATSEPGVQLAVARWDGPSGAGLVLPSWLYGPDAPWLCTADCVVRLATEPGGLAAPWRPAQLDGRPHQLGLFAFRWQGGVVPANDVPIQAGWLLQRGPVPESGVLPIAIGLSGALGWTAAVAQQLERLQTALTFAQERFASVGVTLQVQYVDWPAANVLLAHTTDDLELAALWQSAPAGVVGVPIVLVEQLYRETATGPQPIAGLAGGIPGVPLQHGGPRGGVAVSLALQPGQVDRLGPVLAHELGHFLGLFHSSEAPAAGGTQRHDPLDDTAENDAGNVMFWSPTEDSTELSAQQGLIIRGSPWVQAGL